LPAAAAGGPITDAVGLQQGHIVAASRQMQRGGAPRDARRSPRRRRDTRRRAAAAAAVSSPDLTRRNKTKRAVSEGARVEGESV
jgi:hypothetical protein